MTVSVGIMATVREPVWIIESFLRYHLHCGFSHIFLFFDDPADPAIEVARRFENVTAIPCDDAHRARQAQCQVYPKMAPYYHEVMVRQIMNAEVGLGMAMRAGLDWLVHIDGDELFYTSGSVIEHFELMTTSVGQVSYRNFEAIPETWDTRDYFSEVTLFKKHPHMLPRGADEAYKQSLNRTLYMLGYGNGKSATRVLPGVLPSGVHHFTSALSHPDTLSHAGGPIILHYISCGFNYYCRKYQRPGHDVWYGQPITFDFYQQSRKLEGNIPGLASLYQREVVLDNPYAIDELLTQGILVRIEGPSKILGGNLLASPHKSPASAAPAKNVIPVAASETTPAASATVQPWTSPEWEALRAEHPWPSERPAAKPDLENGWFRDSISDLLTQNLSDQTRLVVEVGSWLGLSTRFMLKQAPRAGVIAIDTWKGSPEHHSIPEAARLLPQLFETFQVNCWQSRDRLLPLRMGSCEGLRMVSASGLQPELIYIDADHSYAAVKADLETSLDLFPQAVIVGDDWDWAEVKRAVEDVCKAREIAVQVHGFGWAIVPV